MIPLRTINRFDGSLSAQGNTMMFGRFKQTYAAGGGAGAAVAVPFTSIKELPADYSVIPIGPENASFSITGKTQAGFTINITPRSADTLAGGSIEAIIIA